MVECQAVNLEVVGSSPTGGATTTMQQDHRVISKDVDNDEVLRWPKNWKPKSRYDRSSSIYGCIRYLVRNIRKFTVLLEFQKDRTRRKDNGKAF